MILSILASATEYLRFEELGLSKTLLSIGPFELRWYSLAYLAGILIGYWYLLKMIAQPGAPMQRRHADDFILYATLGIILGGRLGYALFYKPELFTTFADEGLVTWNLLRLWDGGMAFHGGAIGLFFAAWWLAKKEGLSFLRFADYIACVVPFGLFFGRLANFVNGELWGRPTDVPWAIIFTNTDPEGLPRHPSQLYEAASEGLLTFIILYILFWHTRARYKPGLLAGVLSLSYGLSRFVVEYFRNPDAHLVEFAARTGLSMGQWLTVPMIILGLALIFTASKRKVAEPMPREA